MQIKPNRRLMAAGETMPDNSRAIPKRSKPAAPPPGSTNRCDVAIELSKRGDRAIWVYLTSRDPVAIPWIKIAGFLSAGGGIAAIVGSIRHLL
jgi:hypothetical protein